MGFRLPFLWVLATVALAACSPDETAARRAMVPVPFAPPPPPDGTVFDLAHRCVIMRAGDAYVTRADATPPSDRAPTVAALTTRNASPANAERFYLQPAGLGRFAFYTVDRNYMTASGPAVHLADAPSDGADWTLKSIGTDVYEAVANKSTLGVDASTGFLTAGSKGVPLRFDAVEGCTVYPEMPIDIGLRQPDGSLVPATFSGPPAGAPVIGFAEVHAHMAMGSDMSDGSGDRGPSAGGVMYGHAANRFGVVAALDNCDEMHGPNGSKSPEGPVLDGGKDPRHQTQGWPTFIDWPARDSLLHQQMYYRWVERTYRAGLRLMVVHGTNIEALCDVAKKTSGDPNAECRDMDVGLHQVAYLKDIEAYVDAQSGGPGKGWFRIVKDPQDAREIIAAGKLAVVPGLEFSNIFHCNLTNHPNGSETHGCTKQQIDAEIELAWDAGVRGVFMFHDVDSALGATGIFSAALNLVNYYGTRGYWKTEPCPNGGVGPTYFYDAGAEMSTAFPPQFADNDFGRAFIAATQGNLPTYPPGRQCNARLLTELGAYALQAVMKKGFVLDIDHGSLKMKDAMLDFARETSPAYPMISAHGGHGGITMAQAQRMLEDGGIIYPSMVNGREYKAFVDKVEAIWPKGRPLAVGYGADQNGLANQPGPRPVPFTAVQYPFTLFKGEGWGPQFARATIKPLEVDRLTIREPGGKYWNVDEHGVAHYGLIPDVIEQIRLESAGDSKYTSALYNSAEAYLRLWEQTLKASALRPAPAS